MNRFMKTKKLKLGLQIRVRKYLDYAWRERRRQKADEEFILSRITAALRQDFLFEIND
jgi:ribosomal protein L20